MAKKIKGIQISAYEIDTLSSYKGDVAYCRKFEEMTIDFTDGTNTIITAKELIEIINKKK
jgi:hypothetical protein